MKNEVEEKIKKFCRKGNMNIKLLKIIRCDEGFIASDEHMSMMFNEDGHPTSLPFNRSYGRKGAQLGKGLSIIYIFVIAGLVIFFILLFLIKNI